MNNIKVRENMSKNCGGRPVPGLTVKQMKRGIGINGTNKQFEFYKELLAFVKGEGIDTRIFERPRNCADCSAKIKAMHTIMRQRGILEKFYDKEGN
jgi:hypothetical protein